MLNKFMLGKNQEAKAMEKYYKNYNNDFYRAATNNKTNQYANALIDEALAVCGSPFHKMSNRKWSQEAEDFLNLFS